MNITREQLEDLFQRATRAEGLLIAAECGSDEEGVIEARYEVASITSILHEVASINGEFFI